MAIRQGISIITAIRITMMTNRTPKVMIMAGEKRSSQLRAQTSRVPESELSQAALYRLMTWLSPAYPVGAFSYSSGLEWAVEAGDICDAETLRHWLETVLSNGSGYCDGIFFNQAHQAVTAGDNSLLHETAELAAAFASTRERHFETTMQGRAFVDATQAAWPCTAMSRLCSVWDGPVAYPVAVGVACAGHVIPRIPALNAFLAAITANWVSAGVRLIPLGQTSSQCVLAALEPAIVSAAVAASAATLDDLGTATFRADLASAMHETQYTRLFRS